MIHDCIFETQPDPWVPAMTAVRCRCHEDRWVMRRCDDPAHRCPVTGKTEPDQPTQPKEAA